MSCEFNSNRNKAATLSRRSMLARAGSGFGAVAAASILHDDALANVAEAVRTHHAPKAKRVVWLFMNGKPS